MLSLTAPRIIALEGCVGAGKTTIAKGIAKYRRSELVLEEFEAIPFFEEFYTDPDAYALETEFSFLLHHFHKLKRAFLEPRETITDFSLSKDLVFAKLNMRGEPEQRVFTELYELLTSRIPKIDAIIFISISDELMLSRINERGRTQELSASPSYFQSLNAAYNNLIASHQGPAITLSADSMNFRANPELYSWLSEKIDEIIIQ